MERAAVSKNKKNECLVDVVLTISLGKFLAIVNGLEYRAEQGSPVATDMLDMLKESAEENGVPLK